MIATTQDAFQLLMDGTSALARVEASGIRIDVPYLEQAIADTGREIDMTPSKQYLDIAKEVQEWIQKNCTN